MTLDFSDPMTFAMMAGVSIPEQLALAQFAPQLSLLQRLSVSGAMFAIHFGLNGFVPKAPTLQEEIPWIVGTAIFAKTIYGVSDLATFALVAGDSLMTLFLR